MSTDSAAPCLQGRTDYEACFAPFRYCSVKGCGRVARAHRPDCLSLVPEPVYDDGTPNPCDCRTLALIESREHRKP